MEFESGGLNKAELRRKRRKKERMQAMLLLGGIVLVVVFVLGIGIASLVHVFSDKTAATQTVTASAEQEQSQTEKQETAEVDSVTGDVGEEPQTDLTGEETGEETGTDGEPQIESEELTEEEELPDETEETADGESTLSETQNTDDLLTQRVEQQIASMSLEQKVAQLFFLTPQQLMGRESAIDAIGSEFNEKLNQYQVGGIVLRKDNMRDAETLSSLTSNLKIMATTVMFVGVTDEGGEDSPFVQSGVTENVISSQKEIGESLGVAGAYSAGISLGSELKQYGFNVDFAPLADVASSPSAFSAAKGFGTDAQQTGELAKNVVKGLSDQGIYSAVKYFPSYGDVSQDGSSGTVISHRSKETLLSESQPYQDAIDAGADFVMISHVSLPKVRGDNRPASLSKEVITDIVRDEWGFDGIVITDYMDKPSIYQKYTYAEAAVGAIEAGADMILSTKNFEKSYNGILDAVKDGTLTEERIDESLRRIFRVKLRDRI